MTPAERRALVVVAGGLLAASVVRVGWEARSPPPEIPSDTTGIGELVEATEEAVEDDERRQEPLAEGERIDPNRDSEVELARLQGLGPALAQAVVEARREEPFRSPEDLERVPGIGQTTVDRIAPHLDLDEPPVSSGGAAVAGASDRGGRAGPLLGQGERLDLNEASAEELQELPGVGPETAARILQYRRDRHGFRDVEELLAVPGIGPATFERIAAQVTLGS